MNAIVSLNKNLVLKELGLTKLRKYQQDAIWRLILDIFQTRIVDYLLLEISDDDKKRTLLTLLSLNDSVRLKEFLHNNVDNFEQKIVNLVNEIKSDLKIEISKLVGEK